MLHSINDNYATFQNLQWIVMSITLLMHSYITLHVYNHTNKCDFMSRCKHWLYDLEPLKAFRFVKNNLNMKYEINTSKGIWDWIIKCCLSLSNDKLLIVTCSQTALSTNDADTLKVSTQPLVDDILTLAMTSHYIGDKVNKSSSPDPRKILSFSWCVMWPCDVMDSLILLYIVTS